MGKHKGLGFTIIELMVVITVVAILATITAIAYRETQKNARNEQTKIAAATLRGAIEEYYSDKGMYPLPTTQSDCTPESTATCQEEFNESNFDFMKSEGYLKGIPTNANGSTFRYLVAPPGQSGGPKFAIRVIREGEKTCKTGKKMYPGWWGSIEDVPECEF